MIFKNKFWPFIFASLILVVYFFLFSQKPVFAEISFIISNPQRSGEEVTIDVSISGLTSLSCSEGKCYLQAAFTASLENPRYFGFTKNHLGQWYEYDGSPELSYLQSNFFAFQPSEGNWFGQLSLKSNPNDPDYQGPGKYYIKAWRYSGKTTSYSGYSNLIEIDLVGPTFTPTPSLTQPPSPTPTRTPTPTKAPTPTKTPTPTPKSSVGSTSQSPAKTSIPTLTTSKQDQNITSDIANENENEKVLPTAILGTSSAKPSSVSPKPTRSQDKTGGLSNSLVPKILIGLGGIFLVSCGIISFYKYKKRSIKNE